MADPSRGTPTTLWPTGTATGSDVDPADSDFLFHLYRGSELLRDNKVREAKGEIENALRMQPRDALGQDLLARVYFRLGVYDRAIALYESMVADYPNEVSPRTNLALCYLKTGQPDLARQHLEVAISADPSHTRAWGYLGLAFERLADLEKAKVAFERGGHHAMARRVDDLITSQHPVVQDAPPPSSSTPVQMAEVRRVAEEAFHELDMSDMAFSLDANAPLRSQMDSGSWRTTEVGQPEDLAGPVSARAARVSHVAVLHGEAREDLGAHPSPMDDRTLAPAATDFARDRGLVFPKPGRVAKRADGALLVAADGDFACRLDLVRAISTLAGAPNAEVLRRRGRGGDTEPPVGDPIHPVFALRGATNLVLCATHDRTLQALELRDDLLVVREESVAGFDLRLDMESGRLPSGHGDMAPMLQLRGAGCVILEARGALGTLELRNAQTCLVRGSVLIGWIGRPSVRNIPLSEAPAGGRGWLSCSGDGWVLVDTSPASEFGGV